MCDTVSSAFRSLHFSEEIFVVTHIIFIDDSLLMGARDEICDPYVDEVQVS